jgi:hypothetical protein
MSKGYQPSKSYLLESFEQESQRKIREKKLYDSLNDLLNDAINFDGGKLTDSILVQASATLDECRDEVNKPSNLKPDASHVTE